MPKLFLHLLGHVKEREREVLYLSKFWYLASVWVLGRGKAQPKTLMSLVENSLFVFN